MCLSKSPKIDAIDEIYSDETKDFQQLFNSDIHNITTDSNYYLPENTSELSVSSYSLKCMHLNIQSLVPKIDELKFLPEKLHEKGIIFDIILICETFLSDKKLNLCQLDDYVLVEKHRESRVGGGVAIYINKKFKYKERSDLQIFIEGHIESIFVEVDVGGKHVIVGELYRIPCTNLDVFFQNYKHLTEKINNEGKMLILGTDQNIDYLKINEHSNTAKFLDMNLEAGLVPSITRPTRISHNSATLIDNIYTTDSSYAKSAILMSGISDHMPCCLFVGRKRDYKEIVTIETRKMNEKRMGAIKDDLSQVDWDSALDDLNTNQSYNCFMYHVLKAVDTHAPKKM